MPTVPGLITEQGFGHSPRWMLVSHLLERATGFAARGPGTPSPRTPSYVRRSVGEIPTSSSSSSRRSPPRPRGRARRIPATRTSSSADRRRRRRRRPRLTPGARPARRAARHRDRHRDREGARAGSLRRGPRARLTVAGIGAEGLPPDAWRATRATSRSSPRSPPRPRARAPGPCGEDLELGRRRRRRPPAQRRAQLDSRREGRGPPRLALRSYVRRSVGETPHQLEQLGTAIATAAARASSVRRT
jgi:hypothetical protein